jgi:5-methyltetrahydropteroyltriglutamate--homocysteine methyltransferase
MKAFVPGIYPRSEALVQATRDLDRGRTTHEAVDEQIERDCAELLAVQRQAGLDLLSDGMLTWQDLFRPILETAEGLEPAALTRFLDTNTFYRAPHATTATPKLSAPLDQRYVAPVGGPRVVTLPSPLALSKGTGVEAATIATEVLKPQLDALEADLVVLAEPFLPRDESAGIPELASALGPLAGGPKLALWLTFGDARNLLEGGAAELPVAGVVDARSSTLEEPRELAEFAERLQNEREVAQLALVPNGDLQFVSERTAREKLLRLGKAKTATVEAAA